MTKLFNICLAVVGSVAIVNGQYTNSSANGKWTFDMECANCIRGGYDFCMFIESNPTGTNLKWNCSQTYMTPEWNATNAKGGAPGSWMCSKGYKDQMNAIVNGCRPNLNQGYGALAGFCGAYMVDLSDKNEAVDGRTIIQMPINSSCTYRVMSNCGYPEAEWRVQDPRIQQDYDIAWATSENLAFDDELDGWNANSTSDWQTSKGTPKTNDYTRIGVAQVPGQNVARISDDVFNKCNGPQRNLWITITRFQNSSATPTLAQTPRQLEALQNAPYYPGTKDPDFKIGFYISRGPSAATALVGAFFAVVAGLAALAF